LTTLYIRLPARADGEGALSRFALAADGGVILQQGEGVLRGLGDLVGAARRVVLILAAVDVALLQVKAPPLSSARLKAALPSLVEEQVLGDPAESVLVASPVLAPDGLRSVAVVQRAWLEPLVKTMLALGARAVAALPAQLCLPLQPGQVSAAAGATDLTLRDGLYHGMGLAMVSPPEVALQTARALAGDAPLTLFVRRANWASTRRWRRKPAAPPSSKRTAGSTGSPARKPPTSIWCRDSARPARAPPTGSAGAGRCGWRCWRWWSTWSA
jgi:general secretion pathway protein L